MVRTEKSISTSCRGKFEASGYMLFVGAGVSKAFGVKTMPELYEEVKKKLSKQHLDAVNSIEQVLLKFGYEHNFVDVEAVFSVLNGMLVPKPAIAEAGPFSSYVTAYLVEKLEKYENAVPLPRLSYAEELIKVAQDVIASECRKPNFTKVKTIYDSLFNTVPIGSSVKIKHPTLGDYNEVVTKPIVTTNYDLAIEAYFRLRRQHLNDGFRFDELDGQYHFNPRPTREGSHLDLVKLHGSINWFIRSDKEIVQRLEEPSGVPFYEEQLMGKMMIYPMQEKYVSKDPYATLFGYFRRMLFETNIHICIGYSFRDQAVNNAILDAAEKNSKFLLFIINPEGHNLIGRLGIEEGKTVVIPSKIEESSVMDEMRKYLVS